MLYNPVNKSWSPSGGAQAFTLETSKLPIDIHQGQANHLIKKKNRRFIQYLDAYPTSNAAEQTTLPLGQSIKTTGLKKTTQLKRESLQLTKTHL